MDLQIKEKEESRIVLTEEDKTRITEETRRVMDFCTDVSRCRRVQILQYFGEVFKAENCHKLCDVCCDTSKVTTRDVTNDAIKLIRLVQSMKGNNTLNHCKAVFMGSKKKDVTSRHHDELIGFGEGQSLGQRMVDLLFCELVTIGALKESPVVNTGGWSNNYMQVSSCVPIILYSVTNYVVKIVARDQITRSSLGEAKGAHSRQGSRYLCRPVKEEHQEGYHQERWEPHYFWERQESCCADTGDSSVPLR